MQKIANDRKWGSSFSFYWMIKGKNTTISMNSLFMCGAEEESMNKSKDNLKNPAMWKIRTL